jgi:hypothetical protein
LQYYVGGHQAVSDDTRTHPARLADPVIDHGDWRIFAAISDNSNGGTS